MLNKFSFRILVGVLVCAGFVSFIGPNALLSEHSLLTATRAAVNPSQPALTFKWQMPKRFGPRNSEGIVDFRWNAATRTYEDSYVRPGAWKVEFDACSLGLPANSVYQWEVEGSVVSNPGLTACTFSHEFTAQRTYLVKLTATAPNGGVTIVESPVAVKDILIVSIGDSFASGQGSPDISLKGSTPAKWVDKLCARSALAGPAQTALSIEEADPHTSVTFISFACTGAGISAGLLGPQMRGTVSVEPQIEKVRQALKGRTIDALTISIGGNDLGFAELVARCVLDWNCSTDDATLERYREGLKVLDDRYQGLNDAIVSLQPGVKVFITEYPDIVRDEEGALCHRAPSWDWLSLLRRDESRWASEEVIATLNSKVRTAATKFGWTYVDGISERFRTHGFCAKEGVRWVRTFSDAKKVQGPDKKCEDLVSLVKLKECLISSGSVHPNGGGHAVFASRLIEKFQIAGVTKSPTS